MAATAAILLSLAAAGCGGNGGTGGSTPSGQPTEPSPSTSATPSPGGTTASPGGTTSPDASPSVPSTATARPTGTARTVQARVYFMDGEHMSAAHRPVTPPATAAGAIRALLAGPSAAERSAGRTTAIPVGTALRSMAVRGTTATVDLSGRFDDGGGSLSMQARLAQVVFTATQYASIQKVSFAMDGKPVEVFGGEGIILDHPVGRADFEDLSPAVLVESPTIGNTVHSPLRVWGSANVFEARFRLRLTDASGRAVADVPVQATSGTGTRGTFDVTIPYRLSGAGQGYLTAYYDSPKDGSEVTVARIPLTLGR
jgi:hypothetical protein